jgi:hypothetical protein
MYPKASGVHAKRKYRGQAGRPQEHVSYRTKELPCWTHFMKAQ